MFGAIVPFAASMGPRLVSRGKDTLEDIPSTITLLQWGRDLLVAESQLMREARQAGLSLQWGRDLLVAESRYPINSSYNRFMLQWGRDLLVAERGQNGDGTGDQRRASMGPRLVSRGKVDT